MLCPHCGKEIRDDSKICEQCGKGIPRCPACNRAMTKRSRFCIYDGTRISDEILALFPETEPSAQQIPQEKPAQQSPQEKSAPFVLPVPPEKPAQTPASQQKPAQYEVPASQQRPGQYGVPASQQRPTQYEVPASQQRPGQYSSQQGSTQYGVPASQQNGAVPPARRFCINCGKPCAVNQKYCADCMRSTGSAVPEKKKKSKLPILIAILMILLVILCAVVGFLFWNAAGDSEDSGKNASASSGKNDEDDEDEDDEDSDKDSDKDSDEDSDEEPTEQTEATEPTAATTAPTEPVTETTAPPTEPPEPVYAYSYELVISDMSWEQARRTCEEMGGYLATVDSAEEFAEISKIAEDSGLTYIWLGACLATGNSEWEDTAWVTGEAMTYTNWFPGEPSKYDVDGTEEFYLCMWDVSVDGKDVGWTFNDQRNDLVGTMPSISGKLGFICEYKTEVIE